MSRVRIASGLAIILLLPVLLIIKSCEKEESGYPVVFTGMEAQVTEEGVSFSGKIIKKGDPVIDHGFVWDLKMPYVESGYRKSLGGFTREDFSIQVNSGLIEGEKYFFRAFAQTNNAVIYGEVYSFISQGSGFYHKINDFSPLEASWGDTLYIRGEHFSLKSGENVVKLDSLICEVIMESDTLILAVVPENLNTTSPASLMVSINDVTAIATEEFSLLPPQIHNFSPSSGIFQDTIEIYGKNFHPSINTVRFSGGQAEIIHSSSTLLKVKVPNTIGARQGPIDMYAGAMAGQSEQVFNLLPHEVNQISVTSGMLGTIIDISGWGFNPQQELNEVLMDNKPARIVSGTTNLLTIEVPSEASHGEHNISVKILDLEVLSPQTFMYIKLWTRLADPPFFPRTRMFSFTVGERYFVGGGVSSGVNHKDLWEYFPETDSWLERRLIPITNAFSINNPRSTTFSTEIRGYIIGSGIVFSYNPKNDVWIRNNDYLESSSGHGTFTIDGHPYVVGGVSNNGILKNTRRFNIINSGWIDLSDFPGPGYVDGLSFSFNGNGYAGLSHESILYIFDPEQDSWSGQMPLEGVPKRSFLASFMIDQKIYFGTGRFYHSPTSFTEYADFYELNPETGQIRLIGNFPGPGRGFALGFSYQGYGYFGGGESQGSPAPLDGFYKFDPSKLPPQ